MKNIKNIPVKPKDASTLIIIKKLKKKTFILMGQRPSSARFMPGVFVFPGGVLEKDDYMANEFFKLNKNCKVSNKFIKARSNVHAQSLLLAAIRETAEETGLFLAEKKYNQEHNTISKNNSWRNFTDKFLVPSTNKLLFLGRAITPTSLKIRYHARFFIAFYEDFVGKIQSNGELHHLGWLSLKDAKNKNIADVTEFMIDEIIKLKDNFSSLYSKKSFPMFTWRSKKKSIKWD